MAFYGRQIKIKCKSVTGFEALIECIDALDHCEGGKPIGEPWAKADDGVMR